jgi:hypothetical protein
LRKIERSDGDRKAKTAANLPAPQVLGQGQKIPEQEKGNRKRTVISKMS